MNNLLNYKWELIGNCVNSFDENGESLIGIFSDVSDFACSVENAELINERDILIPKEALSLSVNTQFLFCVSKGLLIVYDKETDVHYFFRKE